MKKSFQIFRKFKRGEAIKAVSSITGGRTLIKMCVFFKIAKKLNFFF